MVIDEGEEYEIDISSSVFRTLSKLSKKDPEQLVRVKKKIQQIRREPQHGKPLRAPMQHLWRVKVGSFVLIYSIDIEKKIVAIVEYLHHDKAY